MHSVTGRSQFPSHQENTLDWIGENVRVKNAKSFGPCAKTRPTLVSEMKRGCAETRMWRDQEMETVLEKILKSFGKAEVVPENLMDVVVSVERQFAGVCIPMFIEAMADAAVADGMPRGSRRTISASAVGAPAVQN